MGLRVSNSAIRAALATQLNTLGLPTAWENSDFTPLAGQVYLSEALLPNETLSVGVSSRSSDNFGGIYQVLVNAPAGRGKGAAVAAAEQVVAAFAKGASLTYNGLTVRILRSSQNPALMDGNRYVIPVSIVYRAFAGELEPGWKLDLNFRAQTYEIT